MNSGPPVLDADCLLDYHSEIIDVSARPDLTGTTSGQLEQIPRPPEKVSSYSSGPPPGPLPAAAPRCALNLRVFPVLYWSHPTCAVGPMRVHRGDWCGRHLDCGRVVGTGHRRGDLAGVRSPSLSARAVGVRGLGITRRGPLITGVPNLRMSLPTLRANVTSRKSHQRWTCQWSAQPAFLDRGAQSAVVDLGVFFDGQLRTVADGGNGERQHVTSVAVQR